MQKFIEILGSFLLISLMLKLSVNYALSPIFITAVFGTAHLTYFQGRCILRLVKSFVQKQYRRYPGGSACKG